MIRINLLTAERPQSRRKLFAFQFSGQKLTVACGLILLVAGLAIGWRFLSLRGRSARLNADIASAQTETQRLHSIIQQVQQFEQRRAQLQQRVALIEQLRKEQIGPVHMLDQVSRSLPPMLWLTEMRQGAMPSEVLINGRVATLTGLSDFVANLEGTGYFRKSVEIVSSTAGRVAGSQNDMIDFSIRAQFAVPGAPEPKPPAKVRGARGRGRK